MRNLLFLSAIIFLMVSCGGMSKQEKEEMNSFEDSIKSDTSINNSVDAANSFLNNDSLSDSIAEVTEK